MDANWWQVRNVNMNHQLPASHPHPHPHPQLQPQPHPYPHPHPQPQPQPHPYPQAHPHPQLQPQAQAQAHPQLQAQAQAQPYPQHLENDEPDDVNEYFENLNNNFINLDDEEDNQESGDESDNDSSVSAELVDSEEPKVRGRPVGSKNKPKPTTTIIMESPKALESMIFEITPGNDIMECLKTYANEHRRGLTVIYGSGIVEDVHVRQCARGIVSIVKLPGKYDVISLSGIVLPEPAHPLVTRLTIYLAGPGGQVLGGGVVGKLMSCTPVIVATAIGAFCDFRRLPQPPAPEVPPQSEIPGPEGSGGGGAPPYADQ